MFFLLYFLIKSNILKTIILKTFFKLKFGIIIELVLLNDSFNNYSKRLNYVVNVDFDNNVDALKQVIDILEQVYNKFAVFNYSLKHLLQLFYIIIVINH